MKRTVRTLLVLFLLFALFCSEAYADNAVKPLSFTTKTLEGKEITSKELFQDNEITVVNVWASWCKPCVRELEELSKLHTRLQKLDCGVVGVLYDGDTALEEGQAIAEEKGVNYPLVLPCEEMGRLIELKVFPTTFFIDSEGKPVGEAIAGAKVDEYEKTVQELLKKNKAGSSPAAGAVYLPADTGSSAPEDPGNAAEAAAAPSVPDGMTVVCDGDSCWLVPAESSGSPETPQEAPAAPAAENTSAEYPTCSIAVVHISETEVVAYATAESAGLDGSDADLP